MRAAARTIFDLLNIGVTPCLSHRAGVRAHGPAVAAQRKSAWRTNQIEWPDLRAEKTEWL